MLKTFCAGAVLLCVTVLCMLNAEAQPSPVYDVSLNVVDAQGFRQGYWKLTAGMLRYSSPWQPAQMVCEGNYIDSKPSGTWTHYYQNGNKAAEVEWMNGRRQGITKRYRENGSLSSVCGYVNNLREGSMTMYYPDGKIWMEYTWTNGRICGPMKTYYPSGKLYEEGRWINTVWCGERTIYNEDGSVKRKSGKTVYCVCALRPFNNRSLLTPWFSLS